MEAVMPWHALIASIEPHDPKAINKGSRPPHLLVTMPRIYSLQQWYWLSDPAILTFRHLVEKHGLGEQIFDTVKAHLSARGMTMRQGTIVDATLIAAPSSTKNKVGKRDPEMHQTKKGNQWYHRYAEGCGYGMQVHAGVNKDSGLIHSVVVTTANVHYLTPAAELLLGDD
jgi:IS5 family transposase